MAKKSRRSKSDVGDEGEAAVVRQLRQRGWTATNANFPTRNHRTYDIYAEKDGRTLSIQVSTRNYGVGNFQFHKNKVARTDFLPDDFNVLVTLDQSEHSYYVVPSRLVLAVAKERLAWREKNARWKNKPDWGWPVTLRLHESPRGETAGPGWGLGKAWACYLDNWNFEDHLIR